MANHLEHMARRLEDDPFFLACPIKLYARSEGLNEEAMAAGLKCSTSSLVMVRLCRSPPVESDTFYDDIERIASKFSLDAERLAEAVRRGQALFHMTTGAKPSRTLLAARDGDTPRCGDSP
jgi:hypothetical protein